MKMKLPDTAEVRQLPADNEYEVHFEWSKKLLSFILFYSGESISHITFGVIGADTGAKGDPGMLIFYFCFFLGEETH
jgi:hypothetical protein